MDKDFPQFDIAKGDTLRLETASEEPLDLSWKAPASFFNMRTKKQYFFNNITLSSLMLGQASLWYVHKGDLPNATPRPNLANKLSLFASLVK